MTTTMLFLLIVAGAAFAFHRWHHPPPRTMEVRLHRHWYRTSPERRR